MKCSKAEDVTPLLEILMWESLVKIGSGEMNEENPSQFSTQKCKRRL